MADLLYWWCHKDATVPGTVLGATRIDGGPYLNREKAEEGARFWLSREGDVALMVNTGAALASAIYHSGKDFVMSMPDPVLRAYARACRIYGLGS